jgi:phage terminase Nu1 subunit (DNA packaging protein)
LTEASQKEFADIVGLSTRQVHNLERDGLPHRAEGRHKFYPLPAAIHWLRDRAVQRAVDESRPTSLDEVRLRESTARAELAELEVARQRGELVHVSDWEREFAEPLARMRARLLALPGRIASELPLPPVESVEVIERVVHEFMSELARGDDGGDEGEPDA